MTSIISVPYHPLDIIIPLPETEPTDECLELLRKLCTELLDLSDTYSVTFSAITCPAGKNYLFSLKPHYWETEPGVWGTSCAEYH
jgi:hypothetical protein